MSDWDSADILQRCKDTAQEPTQGDVTSDAQWYQLLSNAQQKVTRLFASHVPHVLMTAPAAMSTADGGATYTFPNSDWPLGEAEIRVGRSGRILIPGADFSPHADFVFEGNRIRMPNGRTQTFADTLYTRYVRQPVSISASVEPTLQPEPARILLVYDAVAEWARQGGLRDPSPFLQLFQHTCWGDPMNPGDTGIIGSLKGQMFGQGSDPAYALGTSRFWWRGPLR